MVKKILIALAALVITAGVLYAVDPTTFTDVTVTDDLIVTDDASVGGDLTVTGGLTAATLAGTLSGAVAATTITASSTAVITGAFDARSTAEFAGVVTCSSTVAVQGAASFADSVYFADDVVATTFTGALTGAVTGNVNATTLDGDTITITATVAANVNRPGAPVTGQWCLTATDTLWCYGQASWLQAAP